MLVGQILKLVRKWPTVVSRTDLINKSKSCDFQIIKLAWLGCFAGMGRMFRWHGLDVSKMWSLMHSILWTYACKIGNKNLAHAGLSVELVTIEVGCLGQFLPSSVTNIYLNILQDRCLNKLLELLFSCSYRIFNACSSELWDVSEMLNSYS